MRKKESMRIGIDARFLTHPQKGGFKTYTENLISALAEVDQDNEYILYLDRQPDDFTNIPNKANFSYRVARSPLPFVGVVWREQIQLPRKASQDKLDLLHSLCLTSPLVIGCPSVVTIHDMIWYFHSAIKGDSRNHANARRTFQDWYYRIVPNLAVRNAHAIITVSQTSKKDIIRFLGIPAEKISITFEAACSTFQRIVERQQIDELLERHQLPSSYILALGSADPRKNVQILLEAYASLPSADKEKYQLVVVWNSGFLTPSMRKFVERLGLADCVYFLEGVTTEDLVLLYNAASLFVFPSRYEGFGLPLLEAMACGTPVISANNSSLVEIAGNAAIFADADNATQIAAMISFVLNDKTVQADLIGRGFNRTAEFSWEKCALETIEVYKQVAFVQKPVVTTVEGSKA